MDSNEKEGPMANDKRWCFAWFEGKKRDAGTTKAALQKDAKWTSGDG